MGFTGQFLASLKSIYTGDTIQCEVNGLSTRPIYLRRGLRQGCSLSPILFALYISEIGDDLSLSGEGFQLGSVCVSGILFADDIVLVSRTSQGLLRLLSLVYDHTKKLKLDINTDKDKSEVISPLGEAGDEWNVVDNSGDTVLSLTQVLEYKYLGSYVKNTMYRTAVTKVDQCIAKAHKYKGACIHISRDGPDVVDMVQATWVNVAIPSILVGCEMIPFPESKIAEIDRVQNQIAKYALGIPVSSASFCAQTELGFKPFKQVLYEHQLKFYIRVLLLGDTRWVKQALRDHFSCAWSSPYLEYICKLRSELNMPVIPLSMHVFYKLVNDHFVDLTNRQVGLSKTTCVNPITKFSRCKYVMEGEPSSMVAKFKFGNAGLGNRFPRPGHLVTQTCCPLCPTMTLNTEAHLTFFCFAVEAVRKQQTSFASFRNMCQAKGYSDDKMFNLFINGMDCNGNPVSVEVLLVRGQDLQVLTKAWLALW